MVLWIYDFLLLIMLFVLYRAGKSIAKTGKIWSLAGFSAILVYTLNEGLRFGRGVDYNLYGMAYERLEDTGQSDWDISFQSVARVLIGLDIPWQGYVILMSFVFILAMLIMLKVYQEIIPYALPLFALFSAGAVENMVRWYLGFSFIMIGLVYLLDEERRSVLRYWIFCAIACTFHLALLPLALLFFAVSYLNKICLSPIWSLSLYFSLAFFFQTDFMLQFVDLVNILASSVGDTNEHFASYGKETEYWLTGGFAGVEQRALPDIQEVLFLISIVVLGYKTTTLSEFKCTYAYNIFILGFCFSPISNQIELLGRYDTPLMFFRAVVWGYVLKYIFEMSEIVVRRWVLLLALLLFFNIGRRAFMAPFKVNSEKFLYIWDSGGRSYQSMYDMWIFDMYNADSHNKKND